MSLGSPTPPEGATAPVVEEGFGARISPDLLKKLRCVEGAVNAALAQYEAAMKEQKKASFGERQPE